MTRIKNRFVTMSISLLGLVSFHCGQDDPKDALNCENADCVAMQSPLPLAPLEINILKPTDAFVSQNQSVSISGTLSQISGLAPLQAYLLNPDTLQKTPLDFSLMDEAGNSVENHPTALQTYFSAHPTSNHPSFQKPHTLGFYIVVSQQTLQTFPPNGQAVLEFQDQTRLASSTFSLLRWKLDLIITRSATSTNINLFNFTDIKTIGAYLVTLQQGEIGGRKKQKVTLYQTSDLSNPSLVGQLWNNFFESSEWIAFSDQQVIRLQPSVTWNVLSCPVTANQIGDCTQTVLPPLAQSVLSFAVSPLGNQIMVVDAQGSLFTAPLQTPNPAWVQIGASSLLLHKEQIVATFGDLLHQGQPQLILFGFDTQGSEIHTFAEKSGSFVENQALNNSFQTIVGTASIQNVAISDVDGDGSVDMMVTRDNQVEVWLNDGKGLRFAQAWSIPLPKKLQGKAVVTSGNTGSIIKTNLWIAVNYTNDTGGVDQSIWFIDNQGIR